MNFNRLLPALLITFVDTFSFTVMIPVLPFIVEQYRYGDVLYGLLLSTYAFCQFIAAPFLGTLSDKYGRKPILMLSQIGTVLSWGIFGIAYFLPDIKLLGLSLPILIIFFSRVIDGVTGGNISVVMAFVADVTREEKRAQTFGLVSAMGGLAMILGPVIGSLSYGTAIGYLGTIIVAGGIALLALIFLTQIKESLPLAQRQDRQLWECWTDLLLWNRIRKYRANNGLLRLFNLKLFFSFSVNAFTTVIILFMIDAFGYSEKELALILVVVGTMMIVNQLFMVKLFITQWGEAFSMVLSLFLMAGGLSLSIFFNSIYALLLCYYIMSIGISVGFSVFSALLTQKAPTNKQGEILGLDTAIMAFTAGLAPIIGSLLYVGLSQYVFVLLGGIVLVGPVLNRLWLGKTSEVFLDMTEETSEV